MTVYMDSRGWLYFVRQGLREGWYKGFYNKNANAKPDSNGWHGVRTLEYRNSRKEAEIDMQNYAKKKNMSIFDVWKEE